MLRIFSKVNLRERGKSGFVDAATRKHIKTSLCLNKHHMKTYGEIGGITTHILSLGNRWR
jgi:hypothetical protein